MTYPGMDCVWLKGIKPVTIPLRSKQAMALVLGDDEQLQAAVATLRMYRPDLLEPNLLEELMKLEGCEELHRRLGDEDRRLWTEMQAELQVMRDLGKSRAPRTVRSRAVLRGVEEADA